MTDIELLGDLGEQMLEVLLSPNAAAVSSYLDGLSYEDLEVGVLYASQKAKTSTLVSGRLAYEIRLRTQDGEWGKEVWKLSTTCGVSERTIHRWMSAAQEHFGFELTSAQKNAQVSANPDVSSSEQSTQDSLSVFDDDEEYEDSGFKDLDPLDSVIAHNNLVGEPWAEPNSTSPSTKYTNVDDAAAVEGKAAIVEADETWLAFTAMQVQKENPVYGDLAARKMAIARWHRILDENPLDLLDELEMIYEASGSSVPDEIIEKLQVAEEKKPIKPDAIKKKRGSSGPKTLLSMAEKLMEASRELHGKLHTGLTDGSISDEEIVQLSTPLGGLAHAVNSLRDKCNAAKERIKNNETYEPPHSTDESVIEY